MQLSSLRVCRPRRIEHRRIYFWQVTHRHGEYEPIIEARIHMKSAPEGNATASRCVDEGRRYLQAGNFARAEETLTQALELEHDCGEAHWLLGEVMAASGRAEDALDSFQLAVHFSPALAAARISLATALLARQSYAEAETECRVALKLDSTSTAGWYCLGNVLKSRGELEQAAAAYGTAVRADPPDVDALQQLAFVESRLGRYDDAHRDFRSLLALAPDAYRGHHNFGLLQLETGYAEEALASFRRALALQPDSIETLACTGHALRDLGRLDEATAAYDGALVRRSDFGDALINRAQAVLMRGDFAGGWPQYEQRFIASGKRARSAGVSRWRGEPLAGKTIAVLSEQGLGDEIMFASCLPELMAGGGRVIVECDPRLLALFARSFAPATVCARDLNTALAGNLQQRPDYEISIGSLPLHFRRGPDAFPRTAGYLKADVVKKSRWRKTLGSGGRLRQVGIAWRGGTLRNRQFLRSLELAQLMPVLRQPGCVFTSLQYGEWSRELQAMRDSGGTDLREMAATIAADIDELAAAIAALDLVITVDNTIAHLAGALGVPAWVLLPFSAEWRYGREGETMPWYPSLRLFRQPAPREWEAVIARIAQMLGQDN